MVFEIYGLMLMLHQDARLLRGKDSMQRARGGLQRLFDHSAVPGARAGAVAPATRKAAATGKSGPAQAGRNH